MSDDIEARRAALRAELIGELPVPVVAAVEGYAMAGGFGLIQACDIAIARDDAVLADNHVRAARHGGRAGGPGRRHRASCPRLRRPLACLA